jgi:hypothetical protein
MTILLGAGAVHLGGTGEIDGHVRWAGAADAGDLMIAINSEEGSGQSVHIDPQGHFAYARVFCQI